MSKKLLAGLICVLVVVSLAPPVQSAITEPSVATVAISDWYDLDAIRHDLSGHYVLMNGLDSTTEGYAELAGPTANDGKGWEPIGYRYHENGYLWVEGFAGTLDGGRYAISDLVVNRPDEELVGLFGAVGDVGHIQDVVMVNTTVTGEWSVGGLVGLNHGTVSGCSFSNGSVTGDLYVGGLVGRIYDGSVSNSYCSSGSVTGARCVGGLVGRIWPGTVSNSYYDYHEVLVNGENVISAGALFVEDFDEWLTNDKFLDVNDRLSEEDGYYLIDDIGDFKELLVFGQDSSLRFRLRSDLDLGGESGFYVPYLAGALDGSGHRISNLRFNSDSVAQVGLFGYLAFGGEVTQLGVENVNVSGDVAVGGLVGHNHGTVSDSYATGSVSGRQQAGGLVGHSHDGTVSNCFSSSDVIGTAFVGGLVGVCVDAALSNSYSTGGVTGEQLLGGLAGWNSGPVSNSYSTGSVTGEQYVGGLAGWNSGPVSNSYSAGSVTGEQYVGGLVGWNAGDTVSNSFWDVETSGMTASEGGTGKTTAEMMNIATFTEAAWHIAGVPPGVVYPDFTWNIVDGRTYPFLSWEEVRGTQVEASLTETVTDGTVDARAEADTEVVVAGTATVTVARYPDNPADEAPPLFLTLGKYIDVYIPDTDTVIEIEVRLYYTDADVAAGGVQERSLRLLWWDGSEWAQCSDSGVNTSAGYIWAKVRADTTPSLADLEGTVFDGGYEGPSGIPVCGCFIATAAYGTDTAEEIGILREFRDTVLLPNSLGAGFVSIYYRTSQPVADFISRYELVRAAVRVGLVDRIVTVLNWSYDWWSMTDS